MIPYKVAEAFILKNGEDYNSIYEFASSRLRGENTLPMYSGMGAENEQPYEVLYPLLKEGVSVKIRQPIIDAWFALQLEVELWANHVEEIGSEEKNRKQYKYWEALCSIVEVSDFYLEESPILREKIENLMRISLKRNHYTLAYRAICAWEGFPKNRIPEDINWIRYLIKDKDFAAIGFRIFVKMNRVHPDLEDCFFNIWINKYKKGWKADPYFLGLFWQRSFIDSNSNPVCEVIKKIVKEEPEIAKNIEKEMEEMIMKNPDSKKWIRDWFYVFPEEWHSNEIKKLIESDKEKCSG